MAITGQLLISSLWEKMGAICGHLSSVWVDFYILLNSCFIVSAHIVQVILPSLTIARIRFITMKAIVLARPSKDVNVGCTVGFRGMPVQLSWVWGMLCWLLDPFMCVSVV